jgi:hypothetical protein
MSAPSRQRRRLGLLALVVVALAVIAVLLRTRSRDSTTSDQALDQLPKAEVMAAVFPGLCQTDQAVRAGRTTEAYNHFFRRAHDGIHVIADDLDQLGNEARRQSGDLRQAKSAVETGLLTNAPSLPQDVAILITQTAAAIELVAPNAPRACA